MADAGLIFRFADGLQSIDGVVTPVYGSTALTITEGNDARLSTAQELNVKKNPGAGEYLKVEPAIAVAALDPGNLYHIKVGPGIYVENQLTIPSNVVISGASNMSTILQAADPDAPFIIGSIDAMITKITISGATGPNGVGVFFAGGPGITPFIVRDCVFGDNTTVAYCEAASGAPMALLLIDDCKAGGNYSFENGFVCRNANATMGEVSYIILSDMLMQKVMPGFPVYIADARGPGALIAISDGLFSTYGGGHGCYIEDGSQLELYGCLYEGFDMGIHVGNAGAPPNLRIVGTIFAGSLTYDLWIEHPGTTGSFSGVADRTKVLIDPASPVAVTYSDPNGPGQILLGDLLQGDRHDRLANLSKLARDGTTMGVTSGGVLTKGIGLDLNVSLGEGFLNDPVDLFVKQIQWSGSTITLPDDSDNYIYIDTDGNVAYAASYPPIDTIVLLGRVVTKDGAIYFIDRSRMLMRQFGNRVELFNRDALGPVYKSGSNVVESGTRNLDVSAGTYYFGMNVFHPVGGTPITWNNIYQDGLGSSVMVPGQTVVDNALWDDASGTLAPIPAGNFAVHSLYVTGDGSEESYTMVYAQTVYSSQVLAEAGDASIPPAFLRDGSSFIASIMVQQGNPAIISIFDERPVVGFKARGVSATADHGNLFGLFDNDHPQYLLRSGANAMTGPLDMGTQAIINVGLVDGTDVSDHFTRHLPNGADPMTTGVPVTISTANLIGTANALARSDHQHAHGNLGGGTTHAAVTQLVNGYMSAADKVKLDGISAARILKSGVILAASFTGTPKKATVTFGTTFPNTNYSFVILGGDGRTWTYESKLAGSIVVNSGANAAITANVMWIAIDHGETIE